MIRNSLERRTGGEHVGPDGEHERGLRSAAGEAGDEHAGRIDRVIRLHLPEHVDELLVLAHPADEVRRLIGPVRGGVVACPVEAVERVVGRDLLGVDEIELVLVGERVPAGLRREVVERRGEAARVEREHQRRVRWHARRYVLPHVQVVVAVAVAGHLHEPGGLGFVDATDVRRARAAKDQHHHRCEDDDEAERYAGHCAPPSGSVTRGSPARLATDVPQARPARSTTIAGSARSKV